MTRDTFITKIDIDTEQSYSKMFSDMNTMTIEYFTKNVYGSTKMYLAKRHHRIAFAGLTGKKTFDDMDKMNITNLFGSSVAFKEVLESAAE